MDYLFFQKLPVLCKFWKKFTCFFVFWSKALNYLGGMVCKDGANPKSNLMIEHFSALTVHLCTCLALIVCKCHDHCHGIYRGLHFHKCSWHLWHLFDEPCKISAVNYLPDNCDMGLGFVLWLNFKNWIFDDFLVLMILLGHCNMRLTSITSHFLSILFWESVSYYLLKYNCPLHSIHYQPFP